MLVVLLIPATGVMAEPAPVTTPPGEAPETGGWTTLEPGLDWGVFDAPVPAASGDSRIRVLRVDPRQFALRLLNASATEDRKPLTPGQWCRSRQLVAAINASMFQADRLTSVSLMRGPDHVNNARLSRDNCLLAFDARDPDVQPVALLDRECDDVDSLSTHYGTLVQSIRMLSCRDENVWAPQPRRSSTSAIGVDGSGRVLLIHVASPYPTHDVVEHLRALPLDLVRCMYTEGGPQAQLALRTPGLDVDLTGTFEAGPFGETEVAPLPVPNVVGVVRR